MAVRLVISSSRYALAQARGGAWVELAVLPGGAQALLSAPRRADEAGLEAAIELAEDWLMPHARAIQGEELEVVDATGRLVSGLVAVLSVGQRDWSTEGIETMFLRLVHMATGRGPRVPADQTPFVADVLLVRELAHHGRLQHVCIVEAPE